MVCKLVELFNSLNVSANNRFFLLEDSDITVNFNVAELFIVKVSEGCWDLVLTFMIEKHIKRSCVVVYFELSSHRLFNSA